jgi:Tc toxin complex TcA C-terminal TcB-binding domain/Neuraminidase-like domain/Salmonella virulence plasmid 28.1kDa A protein
MSDQEGLLVHGTVSDAEQRPLAGCEVIVFEQRIRTRRGLSKGITGADGAYRLAYGRPDDAPPKLLIVVEATGGGLEAPLESPLTDAALDVEINLVAGAVDRSEYGAILLEIQPSLDSLELAVLEESAEHDDITFLARETGRSTEDIMRISLSARMDAAVGLPGPVFYAFLRQRIPAALPSPLLDASQQFTLIEALVGRVSSLIFALGADVQTRALESAIHANLIDPRLEREIPKFVSALQANRTMDALQRPFLVGKASLGDLLNVAKLDADKQPVFARALVENTQSMRNFWRTLGDGKSGLTPEEASEVQRTVELGAFVKNHVPLVEVLKQRFDSNEFTTLHDLAKLRPDDWVAMVKQTGAPDGIEAAGDLPPEEVFARVVYTRVTRAYPTAALAARIDSSKFIPPPDRDAVGRFFQNNTSLELRRINLTVYLENQGDKAFVGIPSEAQPVVVRHAKAMQRVLRIVEEVDPAQALLDEGVNSATQIATLGRQQFFALATASGLTKREANRAFSVGEQRYAGTLSLMLQLNRGFIGEWPRVIGLKSALDKPMADAIGRDQSLATLFGSVDYCASEDCTSVLSPAAYVCDLLLWLRNHPLTGTFPNALAALFARRPDLGHLLLNCPNTDVALPYIDLVNELLEDAVSPPATPVFKQTTRTALELRASPEYINVAAYTTLAAASYPRTLPYDGPLDELRTTLGHSDVPLWQLREALLPLHGATAAQRTSVAAEYFGIGPHELDLISTATFVPLTVSWDTADPVNDLVRVPVFLRAALISYEQLLELLNVVWVRGSAAALTLHGVDDTCDLSKQTLAPAPFDPGVLDRIHRFLRLWNHADWKMWELDLLLAAPAVGAGTLGAGTVVALSAFRRLQDASRLDVDEQLAFFQDIDHAVQGHDEPDGSVTASLFDRVFLNPSVPADPDLLALSIGGAVTDPLLSNHLPTIRAALELSADEATTLVGLTTGTLNLASLSLMYRVVMLARLLNLPVADLQRIVGLTSAGSLTTAFGSPAAALTFIAEIRAIQKAGLTDDELIYVLTRQPTAAGVTDAQIADPILTSVRSAIQQTRDEIFGSADPPLTILQRELAQLPAFSDPVVLATAMSIVDDSYPDTLANRNAFITATFGTFMAAATAQTQLAPLPGGLTPAQRQAAITQRAQNVLGPLATALVATRVIAAVAAALTLASDVTAALVNRINVPGGTRTIIHALTDPTLVAQVGGSFTPLTEANFPEQFASVRLLDKAGVVVRRLHLVRTELAWLIDQAAAYGGLDLKQLPVLAAQPELTASPLLATSLVVKLARAFVSAPATAAIKSLYDLIAAVHSGALPTESAAQAALATVTGWQAADIAALAGAIGLAFPADYRAPEAYDRLRTLFALRKATGASGSLLASWGVAAPDAPTAASAQGALKARFSEDEWLKVAPSMMDPIRERRSDALQAYLLALRDGAGAPVYGDANALFEHFLIDVQMSSCEVTTRVIQAYAAIQLFVERCLMGLEEPDVVVDLTRDDTWQQWRWMKRYRIWEANREVFLYPENWLIETQRPNRTEIAQKLEQEVHQNDSTADYLETVALNYIDRLDEIAHLYVTGTCTDPKTGAIHVVARAPEEPPRFYLRTFSDGAWTGWVRIPLDIKSHHAVPAVYRNRLCLFWPEVKVSSEPQQALPAPPHTSNSPPSQHIARYVAIGLDFSIFRNGAWTPVQRARGKLFDVPLLSDSAASDSRSVEALYTIKVQTPVPSGAFGASMLVDVFRLGGYVVVPQFAGIIQVPVLDRPNSAVQIGRANFDGRFNEVELRNLTISLDLTTAPGLLTHAQSSYGPDAQPLIELPAAQADPDLTGEPGTIPMAGALATAPASGATAPLTFTSLSALDQNVGPLLATASRPFRVVGPDTDLAFDPSSYFFYQDSRRAYFVQSVRYYQSGSAWVPVPPSDPSTAPFEVRYSFQRFYHPYTRLFWHQLSSGGFAMLYDPALQQQPDTIDPSHADVFSFRQTYNPVQPRVSWGEDDEIVDFSPSAAYSIYNWELFFHTPLYLAERLSANQQFEDALAWFHYIFDPTRQGAQPAPQRFWIPKPLNALTPAQILAQRINDLLVLVNQGDAGAVGQVHRWRREPFNPFLLADQRPVAYMKRTVMSYLDNLIAWADNLFSTDSREALNEATLLYVLAAEILGPQPVAVTPPTHADASYDDLEGKLDAFANAMVDIENYVDGGGGGGGGGGNGLPVPHTFFFKIPSNAKLLGYWSTVADRLFKLRHCQNIEGVTRSLALFDAPIDPGLLVKAQAAGVDIGSVLNDLDAPLPNYRFTALYAQAADYVGALRAYGGALLSAIEKSDGAAASLLASTSQQQLLSDGDQIFAWRVQQAQATIDNLNQTLTLAQARQAFYSSRAFMNTAEQVDAGITGTVIAGYAVAAIAQLIAGGVHFIPDFILGAAGFGGTPAAQGKEGGSHFGHGAQGAAEGGKTAVAALEKGAQLAAKQGGYAHRKDAWDQQAAEAQIQIDQATAQLAGAQLALAIAQQDLANHQEQIDNLQKQIDLLASRFSSKDLYDWMIDQLSDTYFQSYNLAYRMCKRLERCYRYELGIPDTSFIEFGYWDSLKKGLLAGETLNHQLRRMQASYFEQNSRRFEISRYISLASLDPAALLTLLETGKCDFDLPEALFDGDYPGHYQRRLTRISVSLAYPNPGRFDNVKGTLVMTKNSVRITSDLGGGYARQAGTDVRFVDQYAAVPQRIVLSTAQDDPGLFVTSIQGNLGDQRYLPFEGAGAISSWHLEIPSTTNEVDLTTVGDVFIHAHYTALDGGDAFRQAVEADNAANAPTTGGKLVSALNDFPAPPPTDQAQFPLSPWQAFTSTPPAGTDQTLVLNIAASRFPPWTRGKTITVTGLSVFAVSWNPGNFILEPQSPLPTTQVTLAPVPGVSEPNVATGNVNVAGLALGRWTFKLRAASATDFRSVTRNTLGDVLLLIQFQAT